MVSGTTTRSVNDVGGGLPMLLDDGSRKYVWGLGLAYAVSGSSIEVYHTDGLRSVRALTDGAGALVQTQATDEFGVPTATMGSSGQPFGYTGEQADGSTGLVYLRARMYDPATGRFLQRDLWAGSPIRPTSQNRYVYVENNPCSLKEPLERVAGDDYLSARWKDTPLGCTLLSTWQRRQRVVKMLRRKRVLVALMAIIAPILTCVVIIAAVGSTLCRDQAKWVEVSPDDRYLVTIREHDCGAVSATDTYVKVKDNKRPGPPFFGGIEEIVFHYYGSAQTIHIAWLSDQKIKIQFGDCTAVLRQLESWNDLRISYDGTCSLGSFIHHNFAG